MAVEGIGDYAERLIKHKAKRLVGRAGFVRSDQEDIEQELRFDLLCRRPKFDPSRGKFSTFVDRVVKHKIASIIAARKAHLRDYRREGCSLNEQVPDTQGKTVERGDTLNRESDRRMQGPVHSHESRVDLALDTKEAIAALPPDLRELCHHLKRQNPTEVSEETGIPRGTLYESFETLRRRFEKARLKEYL